MSRFDRLYRDNFPFVWAAAQRCGAPAEAVDDVVQDVFVTAYRRLDELRWEVSARGWLYGVTRRVVFRYRRTAARTARRNSAIAALARPPAPPHHRKDAAQALETMLARLEPSQREVFEMAELLGMSAPEIAAETRVPLNTVYSRLRLARKQLARLAGSELTLSTQVTATREHQAPNPDDRARTHAAILPAVATPWWAAPAWLGGWKLAGLSAAIVTVGVIGARAVAGSEDSPVDAAEHQAPHTERRPPLSRPAQPGLPSSLRSAAPSDAARQSPPAELATSGPVANPPPPLDSQPDAPQRTPSSARVDTRPGRSLAAEVALLDEAKASLARGDLTAALSTLDQHARRHPRGQLREARLATQVRALCLAGHDRRAEATAATLHRDFSNSNLSHQTPERCPP